MSTIEAVKAPPAEGPCARCAQTRPLYARRFEGDDKAAMLCPRCWSEYQVARENGEFLDWNDAFDNATDEQIEQHLSGGAR
jgi:hypothetical protein